MRHTAALLLLTCFLSLPLCASVQAQSYSLTNRAFVQSPMALGMGDAGVAFPSASTAFFYNPAHLAHVAPLKPRINILGLRVLGSQNLSDQIAFYQDDLEPAIDEGFDNMDRERLRALYDEALEIGRAQTLIGADVLLPSVMVQAGGLGLGAGIFGHSVLRYRFPDGGAGVPAVDLAAVADLIAVGSAALNAGNYGVSGLSVGVTAKYTNRRLTLKQKPLDAFTSDEDFYLYSGSSIGVDLGLLYDLSFLPLPGTLRFGAAAFDVLATDFEYAYDRNLTENQPDDQSLIDAGLAIAADQYELAPSYRVGMAYTVPSLFGFLGETGVAVDYMGYSEAPVEQAFLTGLHLGAQAKVSVLALRLGLNSGYTTVGAGLDLGFLHVDYAYFGREEGRLPGQVPRWTHTAQLTFGL